MIWCERNEDDGYSVFHGEDEADVGEIAVCYSKQVAEIIVAALIEKGLDATKTK